MRVDLDARVRTNDGHDAGRVHRVVWDPDRNEIGEFVVSTGGLLGRDVLIGRDVLERATRDGEVLVIDMSADEMRQLRSYEPTQYTTPPGGWMAPLGYGYGMPSYLWPIMVVPPDVGDRPTGPGHELPAIEKGMAVKDASGETIGQVEDVILDLHSGRLRSLIVRRGGAVERLVGGGEKMEVAAEQIDIGDGAVHLTDERRTRR
jgi:sporulation protein YlmC with PRC-barrel domain